MSSSPPDRSRKVLGKRNIIYDLEEENYGDVQYEIKSKKKRRVLKV